MDQTSSWLSKTMRPEREEVTADRVSIGIEGDALAGDDC
jgi:hypothetical protein